MDRGCYIALEGSEGSGKSTHARRLAVELDAVFTFEHGGTPIGKLVRAILADPANSEMTDKTEALLIAADRAQHIEQVVRPALEAGRNVVSDRSIYSSLAYQGYGRGLPLDEVRAVNEWAIDGCWPDLVVLLDVPGEQLAHRMRRRELDRFERSGPEFYARVAEGFRRLAA
ncbi:MAG TPA: dTMP kinase, partial [Acidimicrobiales bacterium]